MRNAAILFFCFLSVIIYAQDTQTKNYPVYSVLDYGVKNDGTTMNSDMRNASEAIKITGDISKNTLVKSGLILK